MSGGTILAWETSGFSDWQGFWNSLLTLLRARYMTDEVTKFAAERNRGAGALLRELPSKPAWSTLAFLVQEAQDRSAAKEQNEAEAMKRKLEAVWYSPALLHGASTSDQRSGTRQCKAAEDKLQALEPAAAPAMPEALEPAAAAAMPEEDVIVEQEDRGFEDVWAEYSKDHDRSKEKKDNKAGQTHKDKKDKKAKKREEKTKKRDKDKRDKKAKKPEKDTGNAVFARLQPNAVIDLDNDPADTDKAAIVSWCKGLKPHENAEPVRDGQWRCATCGWTGTKRRSLCAARRAASRLLLELSLRADLCLNVEVLQMTLAQRLSVGEIRKSQLEARDRAFAIVKPLL
ncbi:hypothetical protein AK812_SmicGene4331 [Symbiodinium microadriaticum]|uniref:Uncharacterized protein n=1 Tax=Symbiodinium microadriaticum TaxID=2951 RepID=A0A1Q9EWA7_SYMMI|nr:hypothetical protein AK812_SmicGene4331 [Symbiodinium microadriaticum]